MNTHITFAVNKLLCLAFVVLQNDYSSEISVYANIILTIS